MIIVTEAGNGNAVSSGPVYLASCMLVGFILRSE